MSRISKEFAQLSKNPPPGCSVALQDENNLYHWNATITGPDDSVYAGGTFNLQIHFEKDYPFSPPAPVFDTKIWHPNIQSHGDAAHVCADILFNKQAWSPILTVEKILLSLTSLLADPNSDHGLEPEICKQYINDRAAYEKTARDWVQRYAVIKNPAVVNEPAIGNKPAVVKKGWFL